jgi:hypothetical protein
LQARTRTSNLFIFKRTIPRIRQNGRVPFTTGKTHLEKIPDRSLKHNLRRPGYSTIPQVMDCRPKPRMTLQFQSQHNQRGRTTVEVLKLENTSIILGSYSTCAKSTGKHEHFANRGFVTCRNKGEVWLRSITYFQPTTCWQLLQKISATVCLPVVIIRSSSGPTDTFTL